jgi:hypothetical protein
MGGILRMHLRVFSDRSYPMDEGTRQSRAKSHSAQHHSSSRQTYRPNAFLTKPHHTEKRATRTFEARSGIQHLELQECKRGPTAEYLSKKRLAAVKFWSCCQAKSYSVYFASKKYSCFHQRTRSPLANGGNS